MKITINYDGKCIANYVAYERPSIIKKGNWYYVGINAGDHKIYKTLGYNRFEKKITNVPKDYQLISKKSNKFDSLLYDSNFPCIKLPKIDALPWDLWIEKASKYWLTINDIQKMDKNQQLKVILLHRNTSDTITRDNKPLRTYTPKYFFRTDTAIFTKDKDLQGTIKYKWAKEDLKFEFEIEYKKDHWYPLKNGKLPSKINYKTFSVKTHIGFRGPIIICKNLIKLPHVYWIDYNTRIS